MKFVATSRHKHGGRQGKPSLLTKEQIVQLNEQAKQGEFRTAQDVPRTYKNGLPPHLECIWSALPRGWHLQRAGAVGLEAEDYATSSYERTLAGAGGVEKGG